MQICTGLNSVATVRPNLHNMMESRINETTAAQCFWMPCLPSFAFHCIKYFAPELLALPFVICRTRTNLLNNASNSHVVLARPASVYLLNHPSKESERSLWTSANSIMKIGTELRVVYTDCLYSVPSLAETVLRWSASILVKTVCMLFRCPA